MKTIRGMMGCPNCGELMEVGGGCPECAHHESDPDCDCEFCDMEHHWDRWDEDEDGNG